MFAVQHLVRICSTFWGSTDYGVIFDVFDVFDHADCFDNTVDKRAAFAHSTARNTLTSDAVHTAAIPANPSMLPCRMTVFLLCKVHCFRCLV